MEDWHAYLSPCNFATTHFPQKEQSYLPVTSGTTHLTACILKFYLPWTSRPMKWRTLSQRPSNICQHARKGGLPERGQKVVHEWANNKRPTTRRSGNWWDSRNPLSETITAPEMLVLQFGAIRGGGEIHDWTPLISWIVDCRVFWLSWTKRFQQICDKLPTKFGKTHSLSYWTFLDGPFSATAGCSKTAH